MSFHGIPEHIFMVFHVPKDSGWVAYPLQILNISSFLNVPKVIKICAAAYIFQKCY